MSEEGKVESLFRNLLQHSDDDGPGNRTLPELGRKGISEADRFFFCDGGTGEKLIFSRKGTGNELKRFVSN